MAGGEEEQRQLAGVADGVDQVAGAGRQQVAVVVFERQVGAVLRVEVAVAREMQRFAAAFVGQPARDAGGAAAFFDDQLRPRSGADFFDCLRDRRFLGFEVEFVGLPRRRGHEQQAQVAPLRRQRLRHASRQHADAPADQKELHRVIGEVAVGAGDRKSVV